MQRKQRFFGCDGNARSRIFPVYYKKGSFTRSRAICSNPSAEDRSDATRSNRDERARGRPGFDGPGGGWPTVGKVQASSI